ncbi:choice-of-anchor J domain-containing protein [Paraflavisolibacter sp. H34]|uniref:choice-of-anchor J domain-containing protein n=1 Tax=Huijunlia imazamoxiresistens TaxID=3127457 RepID=UPI0030173500
MRSVLFLLVVFFSTMATPSLLKAQGARPAAVPLSVDFNNCAALPLGGFSQYSVLGAQTWSCVPTFGEDGTGGVQINGFAQGGAATNEDWLISPALDLSGTAYPVLSFSSVSAFEGPSLKLVASKDYNGTGDPKNFTWTEIDGHFPAPNSAQWTSSAEIDLSAVAAPKVYLAFVYTSAPGRGASRWTVDNVTITTGRAPQPVVRTSPARLDFDYARAGTASPVQALTVEDYNLSTPLTFTAPAGFRLSADSLHFGRQVVLPKAAFARGPQKLYVRFNPSAAHTAYSGTLQGRTGTIRQAAVPLAGTSLRSLKVVNWNVEWFGSPKMDPANDSLQQQNVLTILKRLNADVYALSEVVDTARLKQLVAALPGYGYALAPYGSYADNPSDTDYAASQKLCFVYRRSVVTNRGTRGVLRSGGSPQAGHNWSSGRFPFLMQAAVTLEGATTEIVLVLLHGKANTGTPAEKTLSWERRRNGARELKDSLDRQFPFSPVLLLGDFNDDLDATIAPGIPGGMSSYSDFTADTARYAFPTLPLSQGGQRSTVSNDNMIDHQVASNEMGVAYVPQSAQVATYVAGWVRSYGATTTDHYPVLARYDTRLLARPAIVRNFRAVVAGNRLRFHWQTTYEMNTTWLVLERARNGGRYQAADSVRGRGDSRRPRSYSLGLTPWPGRSRYRLRVVGADGRVVRTAPLAREQPPARR